MAKRKKTIEKINKVWVAMILLISLVGIVLLIFANSEYHGRHYKFTYSNRDTLLFNKDIDGDYIIINNHDEVEMYAKMIENVLKENNVDRKKYEERLENLIHGMDDKFFKKHRLLLFYEHADIGSLNTKIMAVSRDGNDVYVTLSRYSAGSLNSGITDIYLLPIDKDDDIEKINFVYKENFAQAFIFSCILALPYIILFISVINFLVRLYDSKFARARDIRNKKIKDAVIGLVIGIVIALVVHFVILPFLIH